MTLPAQTEAAIGRYVSARPNGGYGPRHYAFEDHGLNEAAERERFRPYMLRFGIAAERSGSSGGGGSRVPARTPVPTS